MKLFLINLLNVVWTVNFFIHLLNKIHFLWEEVKMKNIVKMFVILEIIEG